MDLPLKDDPDVFLLDLRLAIRLDIPLLSKKGEETRPKIAHVDPSVSMFDCSLSAQ